MAFIFNEEEALASEASSGGSKVLDSGVYNITILTASKSVASTGTTGIDWSLQVEGSKYPNMVYGFWTNKSNGDKIFNLDTLYGLMGVAGLKTLTEYQKEIEIKDGKKTVTAYKELDNLKCQVAVQKVLDVYNGEVTEKNEIKAFFNTDGQTFAESKRSSEPKQKLYYSSKMKDKETPAYKSFALDADEPEAEEESSGSLL